MGIILSFDCCDDRLIVTVQNPIILTPFLDAIKKMLDYDKKELDRFITRLQNGEFNKREIYLEYDTPNDRLDERRINKICKIKIGNETWRAVLES